MIGGAPAILPAKRRAPAGLPALHHENLTVASGEIVAIIGVAGNGQIELETKLRDTLPRRTTALIPEDRTRDGLIAEMSIAENLALGTKTPAKALIEKFDIRAESPQQRAGKLSGGNQQKVLLARELDRNLQVIVAAEPTRGLDIEASRFVHEQLQISADRGAAILMITSDLDEAFALADAIHVIYRGRLSERLSPADAAANAGRLMAGLP
jgi:simple sugar transport system ATP-binding protein